MSLFTPNKKKGFIKRFKFIIDGKNRRQQNFESTAICSDEDDLGSGDDLANQHMYVIHLSSKLSSVRLAFEPIPVIKTLA